MQRRWMRALLFATLAPSFLVFVTGSATAHEGRSLGDLEMTVGFGTEPAYAGETNSVQLILVHDGQPVLDLGDTLEVEVEFGDQMQAFPLEPFFEPGEFGTPGDYRAWFIPTRPGAYTFHFFGTVDGEEVDETFSSGPGTFSDVVNPRSVMFPVQDPSVGEIAERIEREVPRLNDSIDEARAAAVDQASAAADDASNALTLALVGLVLGTLGLIVGVTALVASRRARRV